MRHINTCDTWVRRRCENLTQKLHPYLTIVLVAISLYVIRFSFAFPLTTLQAKCTASVIRTQIKQKEHKSRFNWSSTSAWSCLCLLVVDAAAAIHNDKMWRKQGGCCRERNGQNSYNKIRKNLIGWISPCRGRHSHLAHQHCQSLRLITSVQRLLTVHKMNQYTYICGSHPSLSILVRPAPLPFVDTTDRSQNIFSTIPCFFISVMNNSAVWTKIPMYTFIWAVHSALDVPSPFCIYARQRCLYR